MAQIEIYIPPFIVVEEAPVFLFEYLKAQNYLVTPRMPRGDLRTSSHEAFTTRADAVSVVRTLFARFGTVPRDLEDVVAGGVTTAADGATTISAESQAFRKRDLRAIIREELNGKYGLKSFLLKFVRGKVSTHNCQTLVHNYTLEAHLHSLPVPGEDEEARHARVAKSAEYTTAVASIQDMWKATYASAQRSELKDITTFNDSLKRCREARCRAGFYSDLEDPPVADIDVTALHTAAEIRAELRTPLAMLPDVERRRLWTSWMTEDHFATFFQYSRSIVDIRRLYTSEDSFRKMWHTLLAHDCDFLHQTIVSQVSTTEARRNYMTELDPSRKRYIMDRMCGMSKELRLDKEDELGTWLDIPVLDSSHRGFNAVHDGYGEPEYFPEDVEDLADDLPA